MRGLGTFFLVVIVILILILSFARGIFVDEDIAIRAAEIHGYTNVRVVDHAWFAVGLRGCSDTDAARFTIVATNPADKEVECYVCTGWLFKAATIRTK